MKKKVHSFVITVRFDRKCSKAQARRELRDNVHGNFYCTAMESNDPEEFWIKSVKPLPVARLTRA